MRRRVGSTNGTVCRMMCLSKTGYGFGQVCIEYHAVPLQDPAVPRSSWSTLQYAAERPQRSGAERHVRASSTIIVGKYS